MRNTLLDYTLTPWNSSRIGLKPPADANCAGGRQPLWAARAFLSTLRQKLLQHAANVSAHFSVASSLRLFAAAHRSSHLSTAPVIAAGRVPVIANIPMDVA